MVVKLKSTTIKKKTTNRLEELNKLGSAEGLEKEKNFKVLCTLPEG